MPPLAFRTALRAGDCCQEKETPHDILMKGSPYRNAKQLFVAGQPEIGSMAIYLSIMRFRRDNKVLDENTPHTMSRMLGYWPTGLQTDLRNSFEYL